MSKATLGKLITYVDGEWHEGNPKVLGPRHHAVWLSSVVFDGARSFGGSAPDLDRHSARVVKSARLMGLAPSLTGPEIEEISRAGIGQFPADAELYICPMFYAETGFILPDASSTRFILTVHESLLPEPKGFSACLSSFRRPAPDQAPTEAKASCLYPNVARSVAEANAKGFETGVVLDPDRNIAEFSYANLFLAKGGVAVTPLPNGTFLNGITRQRVISLLANAGVTVEERTINFDEVLEADELFATGNYAKVAPCIRIEDRSLEPGPLYSQARKLYFEFAKTA